MNMRGRHIGIRADEDEKNDSKPQKHGAENTLTLNKPEQDGPQMTDAKIAK